jgi:hypothetical protein
MGNERLFETLPIETMTAETEGLPYSEALGFDSAEPHGRDGAVIWRSPKSQKKLATRRGVVGNELVDGDLAARKSIRHFRDHPRQLIRSPGASPDSTYFRLVRYLRSRDLDDHPIAGEVFEIDTVECDRALKVHPVRRGDAEALAQREALVLEKERSPLDLRLPESALWIGD